MRINQLLTSLLIISLFTIKNIIAQISVDENIFKAINEIRQQDRHDNSLDKDAVSKLQNIIKLPNFKQSHDTSKFKVYQTLGIAKHRLNDYPVAIEYLEKAILLLENTKGIDTIEIARTYMLSGKSKQLIGILENTDKEVQTAISILEFLVPKPIFLLSEAHSYAGSILRAKGDSGLAEIHYLSAISYANKVDSIDMKALYKIKTNLAWLYMSNGDLSKALTIFTEQKKYYEKINNKRGLLSIELGLGGYYARQGKYKKALSYFKEAEKLYRQLKSNNNQLGLSPFNYLLSDLAYCEVELNNLYQARYYYKELQKLGELHNSTIDLIYAHEGLGDVYKAEEKYDQALQSYQKAIQLTCLDYTTTDYRSNPSVSNDVLVYKGDLKRILGFKAETFQSRYEESQDVKDLESSLQTYQTLDSITVQIRQSYKAGSSKYAQVREDIPIYKQITLVALKLFELTKDTNYLYKTYHFSTKNKAVVDLEGMQDEDAKFVGIPDSLLSRERALKKEFAAIEGKIIEWEEKEEQDSLAIAYQERLATAQSYEQLIVKFEEEYPTYHQLKYADTDAINPEDIQVKLDTNQAIVEYFVTDSFIFIYTISQLGLKVYKVDKPVNFKELCKAVRMESEKEDRVWKIYAGAADTLYQLLLKLPLGDIKTKQPLNRLIIIPDGHLSQISFSNLFSEPIALENPNFSWNDSLPYLLHQYAISYAYSNQLLFDGGIGNRRIQKAQKQLASFGLEYNYNAIQSLLNNDQLKLDSTRGKTLAPLKYAIPEIKEIDKNIVSDLFVNRDATKLAFIEQAPQYRLLHLSMHSILSEKHPLNSSLAFSAEKDSTDYLLTGRDIYSLSLNADMVSLSACNTADGLVGSDGIRSLTRAFQYAGVPAVTASLWRATDKPTKELMVSYYDNLAQGMPKDIALQKAQLAYLNNRPSSEGPDSVNPSNWAHLVVIGDTVPIELEKRSLFYKWRQLLTFSLIGLVIGIMLLFKPWSRL